MRTGWAYRVTAFLGVGVITGLAVGIANLPVVQRLFTTYTPLFWRLDPHVLGGSELVLALWLNTVIVVLALVPLYKPQPRRKLDAIFFAQKRVIAAVFAIATLGYFNHSYRLPRTTVALVFGLLVLAIPLWFMWIQQRPNGEPTKAVLIGDDHDQMNELWHTIDLPFVGYVCPSATITETDRQPLVADGGGLRRLGGLSRIGDVLVDHEIDTAVLAFRDTDRGEFFGVLDACHDHGVSVKVHRRFADAVLTEPGSGDELVDVAIEPWDAQDYLFKRLFDVYFAVAGLVVLSPLMAAIALAIKLDDGGPIVYSQERTAGFGESFVVHKFRTMTPAAESPHPRADQERITRVGTVLRRTHLDEIPQLWAIAMGRMSVVGPRAVWVEEENRIEADVDPSEWRQRWFVKPGLTGLAQINDVGSEHPSQKLRYDLEYIRRQSFWFDVKLVVRQLWKVVQDLITVVRPPS